MAYIFNRKNGSRVLLFQNAEGRRRTLGLAGIPPKLANTWPLHIEAIVTAQKHQTGVPDATARWIAALNDDIHERLSRLGLLRTRRQETLGSWLEAFLEDRRRKVKPASLVKLEQTRRVLLDFFDPMLPLKSITAEQAGEWSSYLTERGLARATTRIHHGNARTIFNAAVEKKHISKNPFNGLSARTTPSDYRRHITRQEIARVIEEAPSAEWRLLLGLARYAGLRTPSETHLLSVEDIDLEKRRMVVRSPKTEHHGGHESRCIPIDPRLMPLLVDRLGELGPDEDRLISLSGKGSMHRTLARICERAGVEPWRRTWQTLRASCEQEMASSFPQFAVSRWLGHSMQVSEKHYANLVPDELFDRAAGLDEAEMDASEGDSAASALRQAQRARSAEGRIVAKIGKRPENGQSPNPLSCVDLRPDSPDFVTQNKWSRGELNPRPAILVDWPLRV